MPVMSDKRKPTVALEKRLKQLAFPFPYIAQFQIVSPKSIIPLTSLKIEDLRAIATKTYLDDALNES